MIKLCVDTTLSELEDKFLPYVQWKSIKVSDLENVDDAIISKYIFQMSEPVIKSVITNQKHNIDLSHLSDEEWEELVNDAYNSGYNLFKYFQLPYSALMHILKTDRNVNRHASAIAQHQINFPVQEALKYVNYVSLNNMLLTNSNPAIIDYMFTDEGAEKIKEIKNKINIVYVTSEEAKKIGLSVKNHRINPEILRRAGACNNGISYCTKMLKELNRSEITWDDAIKTIRSNKKLQTRSSLLEYMHWIFNASRILD